MSPSCIPSLNIPLPSLPTSWRWEATPLRIGGDKAVFKMGLPSVTIFVNGVFMGWVFQSIYSSAIKLIYGSFGFYRGPCVSWSGLSPPVGCGGICLPTNRTELSKAHSLEGIFGVSWSPALPIGASSDRKRRLLI